MISDHLLRRTLNNVVEMHEGCIGSAFASALESFSAIIFMLRHAMLQEAGMTQQYAEGIYALLDQQCAIFTGLHIEIEDREARHRGAERRHDATVAQPAKALTEEARKLQLSLIEAGAKAGADPASIAAAMSIPSEDIERVIGQLRSAHVQRAAGRAARA